MESNETAQESSPADQNSPTDPPPAAVQGDDTTTVPDDLRGGLEMLKASYDQRQTLAKWSLWAGIAIITLANLVTIILYSCSLGKLIDIVKELSNPYQVGPIIMKALTLAVFDGLSTYGGAKLLQTSERLSLPPNLGADRLHALVGNRQGGDIQLSSDIKELLEKAIRALAKR